MKIKVESALYGPVTPGYYSTTVIASRLRGRLPERFLAL